MHPLIARFLDLGRAADAIERARAGSALEPPDAAFANAAASDPKARAAVVNARGSRSPPIAAQEALIALSIKATIAVLRGDPVLGAKMSRAVEALRAEGATDAEATHLLETAVLEEAFGYAEEPDRFDAEFLGETLDTLVPLARLTEDVVDEWLEEFAKLGDPRGRALRLRVAEVLFEAAWGDGPQPVTPEHVDDAIQQLAALSGTAEAAKTHSELLELLTLLTAKGVVGPLRHERLQHIVRSAARDHAERDEGFDSEEEEE